MSWQVVMSLLESVVLFDVMKVVSSEDDSSVHLVGKDDTPETKVIRYLTRHYLLEDSSSDRHVGGEWALLVNVNSVLSLLWGLETCLKNNSKDDRRQNLPRPIFLENLLTFSPSFFLAKAFLEFKKTSFCFWKAFSVYYKLIVSNHHSACS